MTLAALDLLGGIVTPWPAALGGLDRLAVDDPGRRARFAAGNPARLQQQLKIDLLEQTAVAPAIKIPLHRGERRKVLWQHAPLAAGSGDIQDGVQHRAQISPPRAAQQFAHRHKRRDQRPFRIDQITCVARRHAVILRTSDFGPHVVPHCLLDTTSVSQHAEITQFIFGQPLSSKGLGLSAKERAIETRMRTFSDALYE